MNPLLAVTFHFLPFGFAGQDNTLLVIFGFIICIVIIKQISRYQRARMWHDTARIALEKGQPLPVDPLESAVAHEVGRRRFDRRSDRYSHWCDLRRGLTLLAVGIALYYALPEEGKLFALIPAFIGVANLVAWLIFSLRSDKSDDRRDPSNPA